jgi:hypothetical protein
LTRLLKGDNIAAVCSSSSLGKWFTVRFLPWSVAPNDATPVQRQNFANVQRDAIGGGLATTAYLFVPIFLARFGATSFQIGLFTAMPAITGIFLSVVAGRFLQSRRDFFKWWNGSRLVSFSAYALIGLTSLVVPKEGVVVAVLVLWALLTVPRTLMHVGFTVVMNLVAGPRGRYELMSRRWSIVGLVASISGALVGLVLDHLSFPLNYQLVFVALSLSGLISYHYGSRLRLPSVEPAAVGDGLSLMERIRHFVQLVRGEHPFISFATKRFIYTMGLMLARPIFPLYYVRVVHATDAWIGIVNTAQTAILLVGYHFWTRQSKTRGPRFVLLCATLGLACYPALVSLTQQVGLMAAFALLGGAFQAGLDLVFFDELMKTVPPEHSATFVSVATSLQHFAMAAAPLLGTWLASWVGLGGALMASAALRLVGFGLFALPARKSRT